MRVVTPGKLLLEEALPPKYREGLGLLDEKALKKLYTRIAEEDPELYSESIGRFTDVGREVVYRHGREASLDLDDLIPPPEVDEWRNSIRAEVNAIIARPGISSADKQQKIVALLMEKIKEAPQRILDAIPAGTNGLVEQTRSGARGNPNQLMQVLFGDVLVTDAQDKPVPIASLHGYGEGVTPLEYWAASSGSRKGSVSVQFSTAAGGYLGKQLSNLGHRLVVTEHDCGTSNGLPVAADDPDNVGSLLAEQVGDYPAGTVITRGMLGKLGSKPIHVRSLTTCATGDGVCAVCSGIREKGTLPAVGEQVGVVSSRALSEPITQSGLKSKHSGGVAGSDDKQVSGFKEMNQFIQVPENFQGGSVLSPVDGVVTRVMDAPAGGSFVFVNGERQYVPRGLGVLVKQGDRITQGDMLSEGTPNPAEIAQYKGIGEARRYFVDKYSEILKNNGAGVHRRNLEAVSRGFISRVGINDIDGYDGYMLGDIVPYDTLARNYQPRAGSQTVKPSSAKDKYLEKPYLHYSIGTRITSAVGKELEGAGIKEVIVNGKPPVFDSAVIRSRSILSTDPDWMTRLSGEGLKKNLLESARMGASSTPAGTSYFPAMANPTALDSYKGGTPTSKPSERFVQVK